MASSPSKRRKLSAEPPDDLTVPSTQRAISAPREATQSSIDRPSFASPTKASIARHNPELLAAFASARISNARESGQENGSRAARMGSPFRTESSTRNAQEGGLKSQNPEAVIAGGNNGRLSESEPSAQSHHPPSGRADGGSLTAPPRRRSHTPGRETPKVPDAVHVGQSADPGLVGQLDPQDHPEPPVPSHSVGPGLPVAPRGVNSLKPTRPQDLEELLEPELPLTPTQRGLADPVVTTQPSGIHNTPSKKSKRPKSRPKPFYLRSQREGERKTEAPKAASEPRIETLENASRHLIPIDPHAEKKKIRDQLLQELQELRADVALGEKETERHRRHHLSGKGPAEASNAKDIVNLLGRTITELGLRARPPKPTSLFNSISSFLPFARRPRRPPTEPPKEIEIPSHLPIAVENQLPYLQAFTPLRLDSVVTILPNKSSTADSPSPPPLLQHHDISLTAPSGLFSARVHLTVDTERLSITSLSLASLDSNAESELGQWARQRASGKDILGRDVNAICWAMARWYELSSKRARFWCLAERAFGDKEGRQRDAERLRAVMKRKRKRKSGVVIEEEEEEADVDGEGADGDEERKWTRRELLPKMKWTSLVLQNESVELKISWQITFDWTGEAESDISASARLPETWQEVDERGSLAKIPETFDHLVKTRGPLAAVRAVVALLMPS